MANGYALHYRGIDKCSGIDKKRACMADPYHWLADDNRLSCASDPQLDRGPLFYAIDKMTLPFARRSVMESSAALKSLSG